jgi:hypothetical protein
MLCKLEMNCKLACIFYVECRIRWLEEGGGAVLEMQVGKEVR